MNASLLQDLKDSPKEEVAENDELAKFREEWRQELMVKNKSEGNKLKQAEGLYWKGVTAEEQKDLGTALHYYRQAVQLVPDIEQRVAKQEQAVSFGDGSDSLEEEENEEEEKQEVEVCKLFSELSFQPCTPNNPTKLVHISALPVEIIRYILLLVVASDLDLRSLEQISMVCKGFYHLAREPVLWRLACRRVWGNQCSPVGYSDSWRSMYIQRPHLHCNGVYISKSSYIRHGERSPDGFYKPFHTVIYYRYLRFFADGVVIYLTCPDEPTAVLSRLKQRSSSQAVLVGHYRLNAPSSGTQLVEVKVVRHGMASAMSPARRRRAQRSDATNDHHLHMTFELQHKSNKLFSKLVWREFKCQSLTPQPQVTELAIDHSYTPLYFSRVHSYSQVTL